MSFLSLGANRFCTCFYAFCLPSASFFDHLPWFVWDSLSPGFGNFLVEEGNWNKRYHNQGWDYCCGCFCFGYIKQPFLSRVYGTQRGI